jgi:7-cyano-7-deazaguanine synthase
MTMKPKAVVLLSGGLDSATSLAAAFEEGYAPSALSFRYGQRQVAEIEAAKACASAARVSAHLILDIDLRVIGGSALTADIDVPKGRSEGEMKSAVPVTYVPARNTIFLSYAIAWAEVIEADHIFIGVNIVDYSGYPDCRPEYIAAFEKMANLATRAWSEGPRRLTIHTPFINFSKADIIRKGIGLGVNYALTLSCYDPTPDSLSCGACDSCLLRRRGFEEAGVPDPTRYA